MGTLGSVKVLDAHPNLQYSSKFGCGKLLNRTVADSRCVQKKYFFIELPRTLELFL